jgi:hypothetical protein
MLREFKVSLNRGKVPNGNCKYNARRLMGSFILELAAYCNQILILARLHRNCVKNTSVNWIIRLLLSLICRPKLIFWSGGHCRQMYEQVIKLTLQVSKIMIRILANSSFLSLMKLATETREIWICAFLIKIEIKWTVSKTPYNNFDKNFNNPIK